MMALANFAMFATKLFAVFSTDDTTLFAKSEPGIVGGLAAWVTTVGCGVGVPATELVVAVV